MFLNSLFSKKALYSRSFYLKLLFSFILLTVLIILSVSLIFYNIYMNTLYDQLSVDFINNLERLNIEFDNVFTQFNDMSILLKENEDVSTFLASSNPDNTVVNRADIYLRQIKNSMQYLHSIILYNKSAEFPIISGKTDINTTQFFNEGLMRPDVKNDYNMVFSTITKNGFEGSKPSYTLSVIFTRFNDNNLNGSILMNFDKEEIEKKLLGRFDGITVVVDNNGLVVFNAYNNPVESNISKEPYFEKILSISDMKGSFKITLNGDEKIVTYTKSLESDFYFINIKSFNIISKYAFNKRKEFVTICMGILLLFGCSSYFLSRKIYFPIKNITEKFSNSIYGNSNDNLGEIAVISKVFENTLEHMRELEDKSRDKNARLKDELLRLFLTSNDLPNTLKDEISDYNLNIVFSNLTLISLKIDNYWQIDGNIRFAYETTLCKIISELLKDDFTCETVNMYEGEIALLVNFRNFCEDNCSTLSTAMDNVRATSRNTLQITLTVGIGGVANKIEECLPAYKKAIEMVKHRFVLGTDKTYSQTYLDDIMTTNTYYPKEIEDNLKSSIKTNNKDEFIETLQALIDLLKNYPYSEAASIIFQMITVCVRTINQITSQDNNRYYLKFDEFSTIFSSFQTLQNAKEWLIKIFAEYQQMLEEISQLKNNKHYKVVEKLQDYIKNNFQDINLSVESLAEIAGYSPYYCTRIFKEITGLNISDFIRHTRINKARELISIGDIKISDIPNIVGFTNISHFYTIFKKDVGLTPAAYREYVLANSKIEKLELSNQNEL